ncbi:MAG: hypothetical protein GXO77_01920 [Calditrichaeota bacterium]|nr:hypothetical protein [Calditrichota bacterium]
MSHYEITITLITIVYGLMLTDLFASIHRLIRSRSLVKWHWLPLLASWYVLLVILKNWWGVSFSQNAQHWNIFIIFLAYGHLLVLLYLTVSSVLPDSVPTEGIDLKQYYFSNHRYFWGLMSAAFLVALIISVSASLMLGNQINTINVLLKLVFIALLVSLSIWKNYWLHSLFLLFFVIEIVAEIVLSVK